MPQANSPSGSTKEGPITINSDNADELDRYEDEQETIVGNGAHDSYVNENQTYKLEERSGDGGKSHKVEETGPGRLGQ